MEGGDSQLPVFWSPSNSCLTKDWSGFNVWSHPTWYMVEHIIKHYQMFVDECDLTLVVPEWSWAPWYSALMQYFSIQCFYPRQSEIFIRTTDGTTASVRAQTLICRGKSSDQVEEWIGLPEAALTVDSPLKGRSTIQLGKAKDNNLSEEQRRLLMDHVE
jgi:hypothetical protein